MKFLFLYERKQSSGMWHRVDMVLTDVSEERITSIFRVEDCFLHSHRRENLKSYFLYQISWLVWSVHILFVKLARLIHWVPGVGHNENLP
jgi:hypothetical protein